MTNKILVVRGRGDLCHSAFGKDALRTVPETQSVLPGCASPPDVFPSPLQTGTRGTIPVVFYSNKESPVEWEHWASEHRALSLLH